MVFASTVSRENPLISNAEIVLPIMRAPSKPTVELLDDALKSPVKVKMLENEKTEKAAVVFSDSTRVSSPFIQRIIREIEKKTDDIKIISAHGSHSSCSNEFLRKVLGEEIFSRYQGSIMISSTQQAGSKYEFIGETDRGTPVELNRELLDRDLIISSLNVQPHYFAGFEGGAKTLMPGCSSLKTLLINHSLTIGNTNTKELRLKRNDVREDIDQVPALLSKRGIKFRIADFVLNCMKQVVEIRYGDPLLSHAELAEVSKSIHAVKTRQSKLILTVADDIGGRSFYQALKAVAFASNAVIQKSQRKSTVVLFASLEDGFGSEALKSEIERYRHLEPGLIIEDLQNRAKDGKISEASPKINRLAMDEAKMDLIVISSACSTDFERALMKTRYRFFRTLGDASEVADRLNGKKPLMLPHGSSTVPFVEQNP